MKILKKGVQCHIFKIQKFAKGLKFYFFAITNMKMTLARE